MSEHQQSINLTKEVLPVERAVASLVTALHHYETEQQSHIAVQPRLVTFCQPVETIDLAQWLMRQKSYPRLFWMNREQDFSVAGLGVADTIQLERSETNSASFERFQKALATKDPHARYFGGFCFNTEEKQEPIWQEFPSFSFVLPLIQLTFENNQHSLSCHLWLESGDTLTTKISAIIALLKSIVDVDVAAVPILPAVKTISYNPDEHGWKAQCNKAIQRFACGELDKIMLARQTVLEFEEMFSPLIFQLRYPYPQNTIYRFYFEPVANHAFFSFTPERLYRRNGNKLLTEALAGTCSKEMITGGDIHASEALLNSEKDIREHNFVREMIYEELLKICSTIDMEEEVDVLQLHRLAHLYTRCSATLKPEFEHDSAVLQLLHPTPAVGGVPKLPILQHIMDLEPFSRGWYAGPVGWASRDAAEFAVGIRSALVNGRYAYLYSGAGLVKGSDPALEWQEVEQKIGDILAMTKQKQ